MSEAHEEVRNVGAKAIGPCGRANVELSPSYEDVLIPAAGIGLVSRRKTEFMVGSGHDRLTVVGADRIRNAVPGPALGSTFGLGLDRRSVTGSSPDGHIILWLLVLPYLINYTRHNDDGSVRMAARTADLH